MKWVAIVYICSPMFLHCDARNAFDRMVFSYAYPSYAACAADAERQLKSMPPIPANATMVCEVPK